MADFRDNTLFETPIVVLDLEATGLYSGLGHRVVEIGAIRFEGWEPTAQISQLVQPGRRMDPAATAVNGITDTDLQGAPPFSAVVNTLLELIDGALLVAHNAPFDAAFLGQELFIAGRYDATRPREPILPNPWLCTLKLARRHFRFGRNHLTHIARMLNVRIGVAHRALNDVYMTGEVLRRMDQQLTKQGIYTVADLLHAQGEPIYTPPPPQPPLPPPLDEALRDQRDLSILYLGPEGPQRLNITPRYVALHKGQAHLIALEHQADTQQPFRLDRIFSAAYADA